MTAGTLQHDSPRLFSLLAVIKRHFRYFALQTYGPVDALLQDAPTGLLERAFRDYEDMSRVVLPL